MEKYRTLGWAFHNYHDEHGTAPSGWDDLLTQEGAELICELRDQGVTFHFGISFRDAVIGSSNFVLAYGPEVRQSGGVVLLMDGAVTYMTAERLSTEDQRYVHSLTGLP